MKHRAFAITAGAAVLGLSFGFVGTTTATAVPSYCSANSSGNTVTAYCYASAAGTKFRAVAQCKYQTPSGSWDYQNWYGSWQTQGDPFNSVAECGIGWSLYKADVKTK